MNFKKINEELRTALGKVRFYTAPVATALVTLSAPTVVNAQPFASIIVSGTLDLNFGTFTGGAAGGTITVSTAGVRSSTGTVTLIAGAGLEGPASLSVSASTGFSVVVSMTAATFPIDDAGAGAPMNVDSFDINGNGQTATFSMTTNPVELPIGGRLNVGAAQAEGVYSGAYTVNANYL